MMAFDVCKCQTTQPMYKLSIFLKLPIQHSIFTEECIDITGMIFHPFLKDFYCLFLYFQ